MISKISELKSWISQQIKATPVQKFPVKAQYQECLEDPVYHITIEAIENDLYTDKHGTVWVRKK